MQDLVEDIRTEERFDAGAGTSARDDDAQLIEGIAAGDAGAFQSLYDRYAPQAYGLALQISRSRQIAEESVQEAFLSLWHQPWAYRPGKGWCVLGSVRACLSTARR